jgi:hypothetical protein
MSKVGHTVKIFQIYGGIFDCLQTVHDLPLLPNNFASATLLHKSGAVRSVQ